MRRIVLCFLFCVCLTLRLAAQDVTSLVDPFIGTKGGGNTSPSALLPWGMVSPGPTNDFSVPSGYRYGADSVIGFTHLHLSGTGCGELGNIMVVLMRGDSVRSPESFRTRIAEERASPGYYGARLPEVGVVVEATATLRTGLLRITSSGLSGPLHILVDAGRNLGGVSGGAVELQPPDAMAGTCRAGGFCGDPIRKDVFFSAQLSVPASSYGVWGSGVRPMVREMSAASGSVGGYFTLREIPPEGILLRVGVSYVSVANAATNLTAESAAGDFEAVRGAAVQRWREELSRVEIQGGSRRDSVVFYTALYHMLIHPSVISDVNGEYPRIAPGSGAAGTGRSVDHVRYSIFSLWDTYRTVHPFLSLVYPERQADMVWSLLGMYAEGKRAPKWELVGNETDMMVGDPAAIVVADSYVRGIRPLPVDSASSLVTRGARLGPGATEPPGRFGYNRHVAFGYIPMDIDSSEGEQVWGPVSTSLEYCLADWSVARLAGLAGDHETAREFQRRSSWYVNLFDTSTGFMRPRNRNGSWYSPFDPASLEGSMPWTGSGGAGFVEGTAWNYTWFVPHDVPGLQRLFRGRFVERLQRCFDDRWFNITNEPDIAYPYLFTRIPGEAWRTQKEVRHLLATAFSDAPDGLPGNDDCGTISGWFVFSALGLYPDCPGDPLFTISDPLFAAATLHLPGKDGRITHLVIERTGDRARPVGSVRLNQNTSAGFRVSHADLVKGGKLVLEP